MRVVILDTSNGFRIVRLVGLDEILCLFLVLLQTRVSGQFFEIHYELPFMVAPGVRPIQSRLRRRRGSDERRLKEPYGRDQNFKESEKDRSNSRPRPTRPPASGHSSGDLCRTRPL